MRICFVLIVVCLTLSITGKVNATHIVGGEFELIHKTGTKFRLNLILYFDKNNGDAGARDNQITAAVYRKRDNSFVQSFQLPFISSSSVDYYQPSCSSGEVVTDKLLYSLDNINLSASVYNDPEGYYIAWERCCRNYTITNIYSSAPEEGIYAGQTFYLEFPPVTKDGEPFINSSPILFPPLNDYACPYRPYWVDFQGTDPDGDSLVYSLVTPLNTHSGTAVVTPFGANPGPYPEVQWKWGFSLENIMHGIPDLDISSDGFLTVTPQYQGLYVFAVKVEEYRDNEKIGEVRRDFQLLVVNQCPAAEPPVIKGKKLSDGSFTYREDMTVTFSASTPDDQRCIEVQITDPDASKLSDNNTENVSIHAIPLGFKEDVTGILPENITATLIDGSAEAFQICFDECPYFKSGSFKIGIVAFDDACALPLSDTLRINVFVEPPPNDSPYFVDGDVLNVTVQEQAEGLLERDIFARDVNGDLLSLNITPVGFDPDAYGISLGEVANNPGEVQSLLKWNYDCQKYSFDGQTDFPFILTVDDEDQCQFAEPDELRLNLHIELPPNTKPDVDISLNNDNDNYHYIEVNSNKTLSFGVTSTDMDNDEIKLQGQGINFNFDDYGISFPDQQGSGLPGLNGVFSWQIPCNLDLEEKDSLRLHFYTEDIDKCQITNQDTIVVDIKLLPHQSLKPVLNAFALNETNLSDNTVELLVNDPVSLRLVGADSDIDNLTLSLINPELFPGIEFNDKTAKGQVSSDFIWAPVCEILNGRDSTLITGQFRVMDDNCYLPKGDTLEIDFIVRDRDDEAEKFRPPNVITPNFDAHNEYFVLEKIFDGETGADRSMPEDNCAGHFQNIQIYNRWGKKVYMSNERDFKWHPSNQPPGVYYYYLQYSNKKYKGVISVLY